MNALRSLNYDGFICTDRNSEITEPDVVLTHFVNYMNGRRGAQADGEYLL